ncbi:DUF4097 family beta strand repeat-containing protein [Streptomyces sp. 8P21H-1]|uniref:DUF4097 family beta strand repeat-containing protein n=1 Tax=Streptomyces sp. 8P21H-1 TaxID=2737048 RepID=UPI00156E71E1|nr:DUF4097 family beta strand repeat-containing protein [Streptomyces sp. 8P21H-1]NSL42917.1 DUF4097 family beta strand repeat protein [Streptomyces sp. 8P21H-1]
MSEWSVAEPRKLTFDEPVTALHVRIAHGTVNVVGVDEGSAHLEVSSIEGPPLVVTQESGTLTVAYEDLPWKGFLKWLDRKGWHRSAVVSLAVPARTRVEVGVVGATATVSGIDGRAVVKGVFGDTTLVGLSGPVRADTVSGNVETQALTGDLRLNSVSGDLTVIEGSSPSVRVESVSGSVIVDLDPTGRASDVSLTSILGEIAVRLPHPADAEIEVDSASGAVSSAFEDLRVSGQWGAKKITGRLGAGNGRLKATTVSGSIALLRRPPAEDEPWDEPRNAPRDDPRSGEVNFGKETGVGKDGPRNTVSGRSEPGPEPGTGTGPRPGPASPPPASDSTPEPTPDPMPDSTDGPGVAPQNTAPDDPTHQKGL